MTRACSMIVFACALACHAAAPAGPTETSDTSDGDPTGETDATDETESETGSTLDPACEPLLAPTSFSCGFGDLVDEQCSYLSSNPALEIDWRVEFVDGADELALACVQAWLDAASLDVEAKLVGFGIPGASYGQLEGLCAAATIDYCTPMATEDQCLPLDEAGCDANPLCYSVSATPLSPELDCLEPGRFAACSASGECSSAETIYEDPEGGCWWSSAACIPAGVGWTVNPDACPTLETIHALPDCP